MPEDSLEQVRLLSNLETSRHKLLQIVLFGQPELDQMLATTSLRQLRDRITHSFRMRPLNEDEVSRYVNFRLRAAGYRGPDLFTPKAIALLTRASSGLTRRINILADKALLSAFALDTHAVDEKQIQRAIADSELAPIAKAKRPMAYVFAALSVGALIGMALQWVVANRTPESVQEVPVAQSRPALQAPSAKPVAAAVEAVPQEPKTAAVAPKQQLTPAPAPGATDQTAPPPSSSNAPVQKAQAPAAPAPESKPSLPSTKLSSPKLPVAHKAPEPAATASPATPDPVASAPVMQQAVAASGTAVPTRLLPKQIERIEAYETRDMRRLIERIAATREVLQSAPDTAHSVELYLTLNTDPARIERFLIRAQGLGTLSQIYVIPLTGAQTTRVWVVYGNFPTREAAAEAAQRLPQSYRNDFHLTVRDFAQLRKPI